MQMPRYQVWKRTTSTSACNLTFALLEEICNHEAALGDWSEERLCMPLQEIQILQKRIDQQTKGYEWYQARILTEMESAELELLKHDLSKMKRLVGKTQRRARVINKDVENVAEVQQLVVGILEVLLLG